MPLLPKAVNRYAQQKDHHHMSWLQGGAFLEVSFVMVLETNRQSFVETILTKLKSFTPKVEFALPENEMHEKLRDFDTGYPDDVANPEAKIYHQVEIPLYVDIHGNRKSTLSIQQISQQLLEFDFWFFGEKFDEPELDQIGISESQVFQFNDMLHALFEIFHFPIGMVGYETSVIDLFATSNPWPDENYNLENINKKLLEGNSYFTLIIANRNKVSLEGVQGCKLAEDKLIFEA